MIKAKMHNVLILSFQLSLIFYLLTNNANAQEIIKEKDVWPTWRANPERTGSVINSVSEKLVLQWVREYPVPKDAWQEDSTLQFAAGYHPIAADGKLFVPSMINDCVQALDANTGEVVWTAFASGPVRFAPIYSQEKIYFASDDGKMYCVSSKTGKIIWSFNGAPRDKLVFGNDRLISTWPVRGGPVLKDGRIYFANGVWPFMGIFVYCLKAETGEVQWVNDGTLEDGASRDQRVMHRPYEACPGGYLTIADDKLFLPAGRVWPSCYDLKSGNRVLYTYKVPVNSLKAPCSDLGVIASGGFWFVGCKFARSWSSICDTNNGNEIVGYINGFPAVEGKIVYACRSGELCAYDFTDKKFDKFHHAGEFSVEGREPAEPFLPVWSTQGIRAQQDPIKIGQLLFYSTWLSSGKRGGVSQLSAVRIPKPGEKAEVVWQTKIDGQKPIVLAADGKLFVTTSNGDVMCFGEKQIESHRWPLAAMPLVQVNSLSASEKLISKLSCSSNGYSLILGLESEKLIDDLLATSNNYLIIIDIDANKIDLFRKKMHALGLYGSRVMALSGDIKTIGLPPYFAEKIIYNQPEDSENVFNSVVIKKILNCLRPYGGSFYIELNSTSHKKFETACAAANLENAKWQINRIEGVTEFVRGEFSTPIGNWQNANGGKAGKTLSIPDSLIKAPLGLLWFGGDGTGDIYGRLGTPSHILCSFKGRVFTFNTNQIFALDAYTGRILWNVPSANYTRDDKKPGTAFFSPSVGAKGLYVCNGKLLLEYDVTNGKIIRQFPILAEWGLGINGSIILQDDFLILNSETAIVCFSLKEGKDIWIRKSVENKIFSRVALSGTQLFYSEGLEKKSIPKIASTDELIALNLMNGQVDWKVAIAGFPSNISYVEKSGIVLVLCNNGLIDARLSLDGKQIWSGNPASRGGWWNPSMPIVWNNYMIFSGGQIVDIANGKPASVAHPLTGINVPWSLPYKGFGCSMPSIVGDLLFSRGLDAVYYDMSNGGNMVRLDGFRLACGWSIMPSSGVLAVLNGQQFGMCRCRNPIAAPMGLVHDPDVDTWSISQFELPKKETILRCGINFGAPGNRRSSEGTLWMDYPVVACPPFSGEKIPKDFTNLISSDPHLKVEVTPNNIEWFRHHSLRMKGEGLKWVASSGAKGIHSLKITLPSATTRAYTIRLIFAEPDTVKVGERVFDVSIQNKIVIEKLDLMATVGSSLTVFTREFKGIQIGSELIVGFTTIKGEPVLCGIELIAESDSK
jgi:outer membrane protein assembly factor BamB